MKNIFVYLYVCSIISINIVSFEGCCVEIKNIKSQNENNNIFQKTNIELQKNNNGNIHVYEDKEIFNGYQDLINKYCQKNKIDFLKSTSTWENIKDSFCNCKKITIEYEGKKHVIFIKKNEPINTYYIDILKQIGLCNLDYISNDKYLLTSEIDLSETIKYKCFNINKENNFDEKFLDKLNDIENFKEFCFFCSLLELTDCNPLYRLDNCCIINKRLMLLDINKNESSRRRGETDLNQFFRFTNYFKKKEYFYSPLFKNISFPYSEIYDETYLDYEDDLDLNISALMFIINQYREKYFFINDEKIIDSHKSNIIKLLEDEDYGKNLKMLIKTPSIISQNKTHWQTVLGCKCKMTNLKKNLRELFLKKFKENLFVDFLGYICQEIWQIRSQKWMKIKNDLYKNDVRIFLEKVKNNLERCKIIIKALKKYFDCEIFIKNKKFKEIMISEDFSMEEKENIISKLKIILNYLSRNIQNSRGNDVFIKITKDLTYRLTTIKNAGIFSFLFENNEINNTYENLDKVCNVRK